MTDRIFKHFPTSLRYVVSKDHDIMLWSIRDMKNQGMIVAVGLPKVAAILLSDRFNYADEKA